MTALILRGDARNLPLPDASVDLVVTSPPYFALRSYQDGGEHYAGQVGAESTPAEYVTALLEVMAECVRVLKPSGSIFVNLGDKYSQYEGARKGHGRSLAAAERPGRGEPLSMPVSAPGLWGVAPKSLMGIPWRFALACIDQLGLILRAEIIWSKANGLPESVTDRVRRSHENWFHFVVQPRYFSAVDEIREAHQDMSLHAQRRGERTTAYRTSLLGAHTLANTMHPLGKLPGSVWTVATEPLNVPDHLGLDHFAAFPLEWPRRIIQGWSPSGVCVECGQGRRPAAITDLGRKERDTPQYDSTGFARHGTGSSTLGSRGPARITGYACACPQPTAPTRPSVILDPFGGTGTTALAASVLGRLGVTVDLSSDYCRLARWRTTDPAERARALRVDKPPVQVNGQGELFGAVS